MISRFTRRNGSTNGSDLDRETGEPLLDCQGVDVSYGPVQILFGVDFHVNQGEIVALLGTNGAGKSTLLKGICGLVKPKRGTVRFAGEDVTNLPADVTTHRGISLMPGGKGVFPTLTVAENLRLASWLIRHDQERIEAARAEVEELFPILQQRTSQMAGNLSGGEQQMLALGRGLMAQPDLLLLDEPSQGLGPRIVEQIFETIDRIRRERRLTILLVEQRVVEALELCDRGYVLETGRVVLAGPRDALLADTRVQRAYLG